MASDTTFAKGAAVFPLKMAASDGSVNAEPRKLPHCGGQRRFCNGIASKRVAKPSQSATERPKIPLFICKTVAACHSEPEKRDSFCKSVVARHITRLNSSALCKSGIECHKGSLENVPNKRRTGESLRPANETGANNRHAAKLWGHGPENTETPCPASETPSPHASYEKKVAFSQGPYSPVHIEPS